MRLRDLHAEWRESPAFLLGAHLSGVTRGEQPLVRASRASKVAGTFLVLFWCQKRTSLGYHLLPHSAVTAAFSLHSL